MIVHIIGLVLILAAGSALIFKSFGQVDVALAVGVTAYVVCALASNLASWAYHFSPWHGRRLLLRRVDHAAIYPSITGTFTPFFLYANTTWTLSLLAICWSLTAVAMWKKITDENVKSRWSTASYLGLGAIGLCALPDLAVVSSDTLLYIIGGAVCYVIGTAFYIRKEMPYRYALWHSWVNFGGILMFIGIWAALL